MYSFTTRARENNLYKLIKNGCYSKLFITEIILKVHTCVVWYQKKLQNFTLFFKENKMNYTPFTSQIGLKHSMVWGSNVAVILSIS